MGNSQTKTGEAGRKHNLPKPKPPKEKKRTEPKPRQVSAGGILHENISMVDRIEDTRDIYDYYDKVKIIGEGSTCKVYAIQKKKNSRHTAPENSSKGVGVMEGTEQQLFALKEISKDLLDDLFLKEMKNEIAILRRMDHPNIIKIYDMFESKRSVYMIMDYCSGGDLFSRIPYSEAEAARIMTKLLSAIAYMHSSKVVHRDIKCENVMFESGNSDSEVKVIDFGLSKRYIKASKNYLMHCKVGTAYTMSPQVIQGEYSSKADTWSAGVVAFTLLSSTRPFDGETNQEIASKIINQEFDKDFQGEEWKQVSSDAKIFVASLLTYDENQRKSAPQALLSGWLKREFPLDKRRPDEQVMNRVQNALIHSAKDSKFKKLAMSIIAYNSSEEDIEKLRGAFGQYDANNNGTIVYFEFRKALAACNFSESELKRIFASIDINHTGVINYTEFLSATLETRGRIEDERIAEAFDKLDTDDSGFISKENICMVLGSKCTAKECDNIINELMEEIDADNDGQISYKEFLSMFREKHRASVDEACCRVAEAETGCGSQKCD